MRIRMMVGGLLQAGMLACGGGTPAEIDTQLKDQQPETRPFAGDAAERSVPGLASGGAPAAPPGSGVQAELPLGRSGVDPATRMIVRTGAASLEVDSLETGLAALRRLAGSLGGYVADARIQGGREQLRTATLEIKVPSDRFDDLTAGLQPIGKLEFANVTAEDVGEEFVDLTARAGNARRLEERLLELLGTRTGRLQDVLSVERELARVREEIERINGRLRYLKSRAALSTLSVTLHEPPPLVSGTPGHSPVAEAFRQAWRNFVSVVAGSIALLGYLVPGAGLVWAAVFVGRRVRRLTA